MLLSLRALPGVRPLALQSFSLRGVFFPMAAGFLHASRSPVVFVSPRLYVSDTEPHGASSCSHVSHLPEQAASSFTSRCQRKTPSKPRSRWRNVIQACSVSRR